MARGTVARNLAALVLAASLAACGSVAERAGPVSGAAPQLDIRFADTPAPEVFQREGPARAAPEDAAPGYWAVVPGLPRPERARIERLDTGASVNVALYSGGRGAGVIRLSGAAAEALGLAEGSAPVRVTALRREPQVETRRNPRLF